MDSVGAVVCLRAQLTRLVMSVFALSFADSLIDDRLTSSKEASILRFNTPKVD